MAAAARIPASPVDLELDFKVFINSGKCVLHTRDTLNDELNRRKKKERSFYSTVLDSATANPNQPSPAQPANRFSHIKCL